MKVALITGGTSGIGLAIARQFQSEGITTIVTGRDQQKGSQVTKDLAGINYLPMDVTDETQVSSCLRQITSSHGQLDILVNNAGLSLESETDLTTIEVSDIDCILDTNLRGPVLLCKYTLPLLLKTQGTILNIASQLGLKADEETPLYCATKSALIMLTKSLALRYASDKVRVNCICPGPTNTPLLQKWFPDEQAMHDYYAKSLPLGRVADPGEIAQLASFLISHKAINVTGGIYTMDGGSYLK